jgi:sugar phosphate isomerase/epimerase
MLMGKRPHLAAQQLDDAAIAALAEQFAGHGVSCAAVAAYTDFSPQRAAEVPWAEIQYAYVAALCRVAAALEARYVRIFTAYDDGRTAPAALWNDVVACLRECANRASDFGITLAVQNHHDLAVDTDALLELLAEIDRPNVKLAFDAWSPALRGEDLYASARKAAPYAVMTTNADYVRLPRWRYCPEVVNYRRVEPELVRAVPFGQGFIDYAAFFAGLVEGGFDGVANYEICSPVRGGGRLENLDACARGYLDWMRQHVKDC